MNEVQKLIKRMGYNNNSFESNFTTKQIIHKQS